MAVFRLRQFSAESETANAIRPREGPNRCHMSETAIATLPDPSGFSPDPLTDLIRQGARKLIEQALGAELATFLAAFAGDRLEDGRARLLRHGHLPERGILTGIGPVAVKVPRVRDRKPGMDKITFTPSIVPRYLRKAKSVEELLPWLYLKGVSAGDSGEAPRPAGAGRQGPVGQDDLAAEGGLVVRMRGLAETRSRHAAVPLHLGRRLPLQAADGGRETMRSGHRRGG